jgi:hypothetical protein
VVDLQEGRADAVVDEGAVRKEELDGVQAAGFHGRAESSPSGRSLEASVIPNVNHSYLKTFTNDTTCTN